jgi:hypothetical protein
MSTIYDKNPIEVPQIPEGVRAAKRAPYIHAALLAVGKPVGTLTDPDRHFLYEPYWNDVRLGRALGVSEWVIKAVREPYFGPGRITQRNERKDKGKRMGRPTHETAIGALKKRLDEVENVVGILRQTLRELVPQHNEMRRALRAARQAEEAAATTVMQQQKLPMHAPTSQFVQTNGAEPSHA